jgi:hypothetical protein
MFRSAMVSSSEAIAERAVGAGRVMEWHNLREPSHVATPHTPQPFDPVLTGQEYFGQA